MDINMEVNVDMDMALTRTCTSFRKITKARNSAELAVALSVQ
jgi:hypothetical protein